MTALSPDLAGFLDEMNYLTPGNVNDTVEDTLAGTDASGLTPVAPVPVTMLPGADASGFTPVAPVSLPPVAPVVAPVVSDPAVEAARAAARERQRLCRERKRARGPDVRGPDVLDSILLVLGGEEEAVAAFRAIYEVVLVAQGHAQGPPMMARISALEAAMPTGPLSGCNTPGARVGAVVSHACSCTGCQQIPPLVAASGVMLQLSYAEAVQKVYGFGGEAV